jgi:hypothetical protein
VRDQRQNSTQKQFISSQAFHRTPGGRVREITAGVPFELGILESFRPVTQESYRKHPATILTQIFRDPHTNMSFEKLRPVLLRGSQTPECELTRLLLK